MKEIVERYKGKTTAKGHEIRVDEGKGEVILWNLFWGEYQGVDDHHHLGIARIKHDGKQYIAGFLRGTDQRPHETRNYSKVEDLFADLDKEIATR